MRKNDSLKFIVQRQFIESFQTYIEVDEWASLLLGKYIYFRGSRPLLNEITPT